MELDRIPFVRKRLLRNTVYPFEKYFCTFDKCICTLLVGAAEQIPFLHKRLLRKVLKEPELLLVLLTKMLAMMVVTSLVMMKDYNIMAIVKMIMRRTMMIIITMMTTVMIIKGPVRARTAAGTAGNGSGGC